jgi:hypothetical protein
MSSAADYYGAANAPQTKDYGPPAVDFSWLSGLQDQFYKGRQQARAEDQATAFRNGIPRVDPNDKNSPYDYNEIADRTAKTGGISLAMPLLQMAGQAQAGQQAASAIGGGSGAPQAAPQAAPGAPQAGPGPAPQAVQPQQDAPAPSPAATRSAQQPTIMKILQAQNIPNDQWEAAAASLSRQLGVGATEPLDTNDPQVSNVLGPALQRLKGVGQVQPAQPGDQSGGPMPGAPPQVGMTAMPQGEPPQSFGQRFDAARPQGVAPAAAPAVASDETASPFGTSVDAKKLLKDADNLDALVARSPLMNKQTAEAAGRAAAAKRAQATQIQTYIGDEDKSTEAMKNYAADKKPAETMSQQQARAAATTEEAKADVTSYTKSFDGIQKAGREAQIEQPKVQLMKQFLNSPNFYSGPLQPTDQLFKQFQANFTGIDPNKAMDAEGFKKVAADMLTSQIKALGASGAGPVRIAEVKNMQKSIANLGVTPASNRLLVEIYDRAYKDVQNTAALASQYDANLNNIPGKKNAGLDKAIADYYNQHPMFSPEELKDPRLIAPPEFKTARDAYNAKLPVGQPVIIAGQRLYVHK